MLLTQVLRPLKSLPSRISSQIIKILINLIGSMTRRLGNSNRKMEKGANMGNRVYRLLRMASNLLSKLLRGNATDVARPVMGQPLAPTKTLSVIIVIKWGTLNGLADVPQGTVNW
jgi:hypothetical protein